MCSNFGNSKIQDLGIGITSQWSPDVSRDPPSLGPIGILGCQHGHGKSLHETDFPSELWPYHSSRSSRDFQSPCLMREPIAKGGPFASRGGKRTLKACKRSIREDSALSTSPFLAWQAWKIIHFEWENIGHLTWQGNKNHFFLFRNSLRFSWLGNSPCLKMGK